MPRQGEGLARKELTRSDCGRSTLEAWHDPIVDGQTTRLELCLVVQRSVRESDSDHGAKELSKILTPRCRSAILTTEERVALAKVGIPELPYTLAS